MGGGDGGEVRTRTLRIQLAAAASKAAYRWPGSSAGGRGGGILLDSRTLLLFKGSSFQGSGLMPSIGSASMQCQQMQ